MCLPESAEVAGEMPAIPIVATNVAAKAAIFILV
jgi:hypothetical protein